MFAKLQKVKTIQNLLCLVSVNYVCGSGESHCKELKERKVSNVFEAEQAPFLEMKRRWMVTNAFAGGSCTKEALHQSTKTNIFSEINLEKGMLMKRELAKWLAYYWKILNLRR